MDGSTLPFPSAPSASTAGYTLGESTHHRRVEPRHVPDDAPNGYTGVIGKDTAASPAPIGPATVTLTVDGHDVASVAVARTVPAAFTASETFGVGFDLGSPVSPDYFDRRPFRFTGTIGYVDVDVFPPGQGG